MIVRNQGVVLASTLLLAAYYLPWRCPEINSKRVILENKITVFNCLLSSEGCDSDSCLTLSILLMNYKLDCQKRRRCLSEYLFVGSSLTTKSMLQDYLGFLEKKTGSKHGCLARTTPREAVNSCTNP